jgi:uncharacterized protein (DUF3084 family)
MPEGERVNVYLPYTLAQAVRDARNAGADLNLSGAAAQGIARALNGRRAAAVPEEPAAVSEDQDQCAEVVAQLAILGRGQSELERELARIRGVQDQDREERRQHAATVEGWIKAGAVLGTLLLGVYAVTNSL